jgi:hypothetical protein
MSITTACVIDGMSDADYHGDPVEGGSLSSTGAKAILRSPAHYKWQQENDVKKATFDLGHAVHSMVLGVGLEIIAIPDDVLASNGAASTKEAKAFIAEAREAGKVPLKADVVAECTALTEAVLAHPLARTLLDQKGKAEQSLFAQDPETGVWLRARIDYLTDASEGSTIVDLKTAASADPRDFGRSAAEFGYDIQHCWYQYVLELARGDKNTDFRFIVVEKSAPYLVSVIELDGLFSIIGNMRMRRAIETYKKCKEINEWPGYEAISHLVGPPSWLSYEEELEI